MKFVLNWFGGKISLVNAVMVSGHWLSVWCVCVLCTQRLFVFVEPRPLTRCLLEIREETHFTQSQTSLHTR